MTERLKAAQRSREGGNLYVPKPLNGRAQQPSDERDRQRRRVDSVTGASVPQAGGPSRSPERPIQPRPVAQNSATATLYGALPAVRIPSTSPTSAYVSPITTRPGGNEAIEREDTEDVEEGITDGVGQLSINEEAQVRFHGKASGLHLLGSKIRMDGRNKGGVWFVDLPEIVPHSMNGLDYLRICLIY